MAQSTIDVGQMVRHVLFALVMGAVGAGASITLCICVDFSLNLFYAHPWLAVALPATGALSLVLYRALDLDYDLTTHKVIHYLRANQEISPKLTPGILFGTCLSVLGGASVGKEAGALQMGASLGNLVARPFHLSQVLKLEKKHDLFGYTAATGMAATFSALFFSPLGATFLVLELCRYRRGITRHALTILLASFVGCAIAYPFHIGDILPTVAIPSLAWPYVGKSLIVGVACALVGAVYAFCIDWLQRHTIAIKKNYYLWVVVGGIIIAALMLGFGWTNYGGAGAPLIKISLENQEPSWGFAIKGLLTVLALGLWFRGGEIMPTLTTGALLGAACCVMTGTDAGFSSALGIMAFFTAVIRAPLASFFMGCEIFGWAMAPYFAIAVIVAYSIGGDMGIYGLGVSASIERVGTHLQQRLGQLPGGIIVAHAPEIFQPLEERHPLEDLTSEVRENDHNQLSEAQAKEALDKASALERRLYRIHEGLRAVEEALEESDNTTPPATKLPGAK